jgi:23S rRNA pseudouridine1911/1915/1917 synthase
MRDSINRNNFTKTRRSFLTTSRDRSDSESHAVREVLDLFLQFALSSTWQCGKKALFMKNPYNRGFEYRRCLGSDAAGVQVIEYLSRCYSAFSREEWLARIHSGRVLLDGIPIEEHQRLSPGQMLTWLRPPWQEPEVPRSFAILYKDEYFLAVAKPSGLPTLPAGGLFVENTLLSLVRRHFPGANPLHRLGRGTSGIVLFALVRDAAGKILQAWRAGEVLKIYRALAAGCPKDDEFTVTAAIGPVPHPILKTVHGVCSEGKSAHSHVKVLERRGSTSLVEVTIMTGRPHQIRIHLAAAGYPLAGDPLYVAGGVPADDSRALPSDIGYSLHNGLLGFSHPAGGQWTEITCWPPPLLRLRNKENGGNQLNLTLA